VQAEYLIKRGRHLDLLFTCIIISIIELEFKSGHMTL
jgi:hypothetical protein